MCLRELNQVRELFDSLKGALVGVGMTAFSRIIPAYFLDSYHIVALSRTADLPLLRKMTNIFCLEEEGGALPQNGRNSACLLADELTKRYLDRLPDPKHLLLYQNYPELEQLATKERWVLLANPADLRLRLGERRFFQQMVVNSGLRQVPGAIWPIEVIDERDYEAWVRNLGPELVIQLPEIGQGGGRGTFFIHSAEEYHLLAERLRKYTWGDIRLKSVLIRQFMAGTPVSMAICVTRHGILTSGLQQQLIDLPYCKDSLEDGIFCGHVWDEKRWASVIQEDALTQANRIGDYVASLGYRGILGIDFIVDKEGQQVYPLEINPRLTGAFPMLSLLHLRNGVIPMDIFHMLEFSGISYRIDVKALNQAYHRTIEGSHLLLFFPPGGEHVRGAGLQAGLYEYEPEDGAIRFIKEGTGYRDIQNRNQFIVVDGPPVCGSKKRVSADPFSRLCHLLFPCPVSDDTGALSSHTRRVLEWIYGSYFDTSLIAIPRALATPSPYA